MKTYLKDLTPEEIIKRLKNGEIIKSEEDRDDICIKYYDGVICRAYKDGSFTINAGFTNDNACEYYFETKEPFSLEVDKFYRTKDNKKVYIYEKNRGYSFGVILGHGVCSWHNNTKEVCYKEKNESLKIVGKWED